MNPNRSTPPMVSSQILQLISLIAFTAFVAVAQTSRAQVGTGWTSVTYKKAAHYGGSWGGHYSNVNGVETFWTHSGEQRAEIMLYEPKWTSGQWQFQGEVNVKSGSGGSGGTSIQQVFGVAGQNTAAAQVRVYNTSGGTIRNFGSGQPSNVLATSVYGVYRRLNVIHDASGNRIKFYVNGTLKSDVKDGGDSTHYFKYGVYLRSETNPQSQWKNIKVFKK